VTGLWSVVVPEATTNLITNPSIELATTSWVAAAGATLARVGAATVQPRRGTWSLSLAPTASTYDGAYIAVALTAGTTYTFSVDVYGVNAIPYRITFADSSGNALGTPTTFTGSAAWGRQTVTYAAVATATHRLYVTKNNHASTGAFYLDGAQCEAKAYATTYCDGDQPGCSWTGVAHASSSTRTATSRYGGRLRNLDDYYFYVTGTSGISAPPVVNYSSDYPVADGAMHEHTKVRGQTFTLTGELIGTSLATLHSRRSALWSLLRPNAAQEPLIVQKQISTGTPVRVSAHYDGGIEAAVDNGFSSRIALRFYAPDPTWVSGEL